MIERLESRRLLAVSVTASQSGGVVSVNGGSDGHTINIFERTDSPDGTITVEDVQAGTTQTFSGVTLVDFNGSAGTDTVFMSGRSVKYDANGNGGADFLVISDLGTASSRISGDGDADDITILAANQTTIIGDGGGDKLYVEASVGAGETWIYGLGGGDIITVEAGINHIDGGGGQDILIDVSGGTAVNIIISVESTQTP